jgi:nucleotide-binding universal stress UspA family protein
MLQQILVAWDGSRPAHRAYEFALDLARRYDAELTVISVAHSPAHAETEADRAESIDAARRYLEESFTAARRQSERVGVNLDYLIIEGANPPTDIVRYAHEHGFDLVVIGHHRNRRAGRFLIHGLAERMIADAPMPVLVVSDDSEP